MKDKRVLFAVIVITIVISVCNAAQVYSIGKWKRASIISLIAHPEKYHEKSIQIQGYLMIERENTAIYLSKEDALKHITKNAIWLLFKTEDYQKYSELHDSYVFVDGDFNMNVNMNNFSGSIQDISRIFRYPHRR